MDGDIESFSVPGRADAALAAPAGLPPPAAPADVAALLARMRAAPWLTLLLDYDGTLVPFVDRPEHALPDDGLLALLRALAARPRTSVHVTSGRAPDMLEAWLGALPVALHGEHGLWSRMPGAAWTIRARPPQEWRAVARTMLDEATARTPGAFVEEKTAGLAWHHRQVASWLGESRARELRQHLVETIGRSGAEVLVGAKVVEIRPRGIHKGQIVASIVATAPPGGIVVAMGDDQTDEDLFTALPPGGVAVHIGPEPSHAAVRLADVAAARAFLRTLVEPS